MTHKKPMRFAMRFERAISLIVFVTLIWSLPACIITTDDDDGVLSVLNDSSFVIEELRVARVGSRFYGPDLLAGRALFPGESIAIRLDCDFYDVLFVDALNLECVVLDIDVCFDRTVFVIDDVLLNTCAFSSAAKLAPQQVSLGLDADEEPAPARENSPY